jgi:hypothetical protein
MVDTNPEKKSETNEQNANTKKVNKKKTSEKTKTKKAASTKITAVKKTAADKISNQPEANKLIVEAKSVSRSLDMRSVLLEIRRQRVRKTTLGKINPAVLERRLSGK